MSPVCLFDLPNICTCGKVLDKLISLLAELHTLYKFLVPLSTLEFNTQLWVNLLLIEYSALSSKCALIFDYVQGCCY